jgi:plastocyanin
MRAIGALAAAAVLACVIVGEAAKPATVKVAIENMKYSPADVTVNAGDTIVWTNNDVVAHTVTSTTGLFDSQMIAPGASWKYVTKKTGTFEYKCSYHQPMTSRFTVR